MNIVVGSSKEFSETQKNELYSYRYNVFVERLGWDLDACQGLETDAYDHDKTVYVIAKDDEEEIVGCARLLPTTLPYLLEEVFPELLNGLVPPKASDIWELSRFTSLNLAEGLRDNNGQLSNKTTAELLMHAIKIAKARGAKRIISVSPIGVERLLRSLGIKSHRAGPPITADGHTLIACWIDL